MRSKEELEAAISKTLNSLEDMTRAEAPVFLYTRTVTRLREGKSNIFEKIAYYMSKPAVALLIVIFILTADAGFVLRKMQTGSSSPEPVTSMYQEDFDLAANFYDYEMHDSE